MAIDNKIALVIIAILCLNLAKITYKLNKIILTDLESSSSI